MVKSDEFENLYPVLYTSFFLNPDYVAALSLCSLRSDKNLSEKPLSSTWITSVFISICSLEIVQFVANLAIIAALKCSGLLHAFRCVVEKN